MCKNGRSRYCTCHLVNGYAYHLVNGRIFSSHSEAQEKQTASSAFRTKYNISAFLFHARRTLFLSYRPNPKSCFPRKLKINVNWHKMYVDIYYLPWGFPRLRMHITNPLRKYHTALQMPTVSAVRLLVTMASPMRLQESCDSEGEENEQKTSKLMPSKAREETEHTSLQDSMLGLLRDTWGPPCLVAGF